MAKLSKGLGFFAQTEVAKNRLFEAFQIFLQNPLSVNTFLLFLLHSLC